MWGSRRVGYVPPRTLEVPSTPGRLWLCRPEIYVCTYVCTEGCTYIMYVCMYVSKSNEGSQLIYIQPWAQGCRQGGWPLRGVRGCRPPSSPWHQFTPEFPNKLPGKFPLCMYFSKKGSHRLPRSIPNERKVFQKVTLGVYLQQYLVLLANSLVIFLPHSNHHRAEHTLACPQRPCNTDSDQATSECW